MNPISIHHYVVFLFTFFFLFLPGVIHGVTYEQKNSVLFQKLYQKHLKILTEPSKLSREQMTDEGVMRLGIRAEELSEEEYLILSQREKPKQGQMNSTKTQKKVSPQTPVKIRVAGSAPTPKTSRSSPHAPSENPLQAQVSRMLRYPLTQAGIKRIFTPKGDYQYLDLKSEKVISKGEALNRLQTTQEGRDALARVRDYTQDYKSRNSNRPKLEVGGEGYWVQRVSGGILSGEQMRFMDSNGESRTRSEYLAYYREKVQGGNPTLSAVLGGQAKEAENRYNRWAGNTEAGKKEWAKFKEIYTKDRYQAGEGNRASDGKSLSASKFSDIKSKDFARDFLVGRMIDFFKSVGFAGLVSGEVDFWAIFMLMEEDFPGVLGETFGEFASYLLLPALTAAFPDKAEFIFSLVQAVGKDAGSTMASNIYQGKHAGEGITVGNAAKVAVKTAVIIETSKAITLVLTEELLVGTALAGTLGTLGAGVVVTSVLVGGKSLLVAVEKAREEQVARHLLFAMAHGYRPDPRAKIIDMKEILEFQRRSPKIEKIYLKTLMEERRKELLRNHPVPSGSSPEWYFKQIDKKALAEARIIIEAWKSGRGGGEHASFLTAQLEYLQKIHLPIEDLDPDTVAREMETLSHHKAEFTPPLSKGKETFDSGSHMGLNSINFETLMDSE